MVFSSVTGQRALMWRLRPLVFVAAGGWKAIPEGPALKAGKVDTRVAALRAQLRITGDFRESTTDPKTYDSEMERAVRGYRCLTRRGPCRQVSLRTMGAKVSAH